MALKKAEGASPTDKSKARSDLLKEWALRLRQHFLDEERLLAPLMSEQEKARLTAEHDELRRHVEAFDRQIERELPAAGFYERVGTLLERHIRWEERELFDNIERRATEEQLAALAAETNRIERTRVR